MNNSFTYQGALFTLDSLRYNPGNDLIFPSIIRTHHIDNALGAYYL